MTTFERMNRDELNAEAEKLGVDPAQFEKKSDLVEALAALVPDVETDDDPVAVRFMDRGTVRGVPARDLTRSELERLSPSLRGEMLRTTPGGFTLYERV